MGSKITIVMGDKGGADAIAPVISFMKQAGCMVDIHAVGAAAQALGHVLTHPLDLAGTDLLVVCASYSEEGIRAGIHALERLAHGVPVVAVQDGHANLHPLLEQADRALIDRVLVRDDFSSKTMLTRFGNLDGKVIVVGDTPEAQWSAMKELLKVQPGGNHVLADDRAVPVPGGA